MNKGPDNQATGTWEREAPERGAKKVASRGKSWIRSIMLLRVAIGVVSALSL